jgi:hypothetical protein
MTKVYHQSMYFYKSKELENQDGILLYRKTKVTKATHHINLHTIDDEEHDNFDYVFIKGYGRLMGRQTTKRQRHFIPVIIA